MENEQPYTLVIATHNRGKIAEIANLLIDQPVVLKHLDDFGPIPPVVEDGDTFEANAFKKASQTARVLGLPTLADDSGLTVTALGGAPGVLSARYGGPGASDTDRCRRLLAEMTGHTDRRAAFECVISIAVPTGQALTYEGRCEGLITEDLAGESGFGYDPIFFCPALNKTFAQLTREEKGRVSHRGMALAQVRDEFPKVLAWLDIHSPIPQRLGYQKGAP